MRFDFPLNSEIQVFGCPDLFMKNISLGKEGILNLMVFFGKQLLHL